MTDVHSEEEDEVVAEYPLFAADNATAFGNDNVRLIQLQYPLRPPWRGYEIEHAKDIQYKPENRILSMKVPQDSPDGVRPRVISESIGLNVSRRN
jgi:hypothetical protein